MTEEAGTSGDCDQKAPKGNEKMVTSAVGCAALVWEKKGDHLVRLRKAG